MVRRWGFLLLLGAVAAVGGCAKQVNIVFVNQTAYTMPLELQPPGGQRDFIGQLESLGGAVKTKITVDKEHPGGEVRWWAADRYQGAFNVSEATDSHIRVDILKDGPSAPYPWKGRISTKRK